MVSLAVIVPFSVHAWIATGLFGGTHTELASAVTATNDIGAQTTPLLKAALRIDPTPLGGGDILVEEGTLVSYGDVSQKEATPNQKTNNGEISVYVVRPGDTLSEIAALFDISAKTILWANNIADPSKIHPGDTLVILPITGVRYVVKQGDTLASIAKKFSADVQDILAYNQIVASTAIAVGDTLIIPDGMIEAAQPKTVTPTSGKKTGTNAGSGVSTGQITQSSGGYYTNPLPGSVKTQRIHGFNAVDLAGEPVGTPVLAAASGSVVVAQSSGWNGGYGKYVVLKHANGTQTLYGHLSAVFVAVGERVTAGEHIGALGNTGKSTGPHLHFEVRGAKNPF